MKRRWKGAVAAVMAALMLTIPALGAKVVGDGTTLSAAQAWVEGGTSYMTLRTYAALSGCSLSWKNGTAYLTKSGLNLEAKPGQLYITVNGRVLYVKGGVRVVEGKMALPLRVVAQATGAGLSWDPNTSTVKLSTRGAKAPVASYNEENLYWLSRVISAESRGESLLGQIAVGNVVLNRVKSNQFPNTIKSVVFDTKDGVQFEPTSIGTIYDPPTDSAVLAAKMCLEGADVVGGCMYFYAPSLSAGTWIVSHCTYYMTIGCHRFYW
ncbi:MAG: cell wall hydrolase [Lawsonibacter sp.]